MFGAVAMRDLLLVASRWFDGRKQIAMERRTATFVGVDEQAWVEMTGSRTRTQVVISSSVPW